MADMKSLCFALVLTLGFLPAASKKDGASPYTGRWDLAIKTPHDKYPSWMEFNDKGGNAQVKIVGRVASVHPATDIKLDGTHLSFTTSESFEQEIKVSWDMSVADGQLTGHQKRADGVEGEFTGVHAPLLRRKSPAAWTPPEPLFNGKDLTGWEPDNPSENHWKAQNGELLNQSAGANIRTARKFEDFKLHIEYNCPKDGNSGVYLRGRYEIQVEYEPPGTDDKLHGMGSIYGFIAPAVEVAPRPGQWESYDVTFVGRNVTVVRDGVTTIENKEIPGITGGALDSNEGQPGPLYIQGDHTGGMKYRNITISVPQH
jgi:opacity protein-like surface antigen